MLEIKEGQCAYCMGDGNGKDHVKPLVKNGMTTEYITDIRNLVPCCQKCNSSKGAKSFREWYKSPENVDRLKKLGLNDKSIDDRYEILCAFESKIPAPIDFESLIGKELWDEYKLRRIELLKALDENQAFCDRISQIVMNKLDNT